MVEVTKRFRDAVLADKDFQGWATDTLPALLAKWKVLESSREDVAFLILWLIFSKTLLQELRVFVFS